MSRTSQRNWQRAFTLIELVVVMAIIAALTGVAVMKLREPYLDAAFETSVRRIVAFDEIVRNRAARSGDPAQLTIDLRAKQMVARLKQRENLKLQLMSSFKIAHAQSEASETHVGRLTIPISENGQSATYAIHFEGTGDREAWLVFLGLTGQPIRLDQEHQFREARNALWPSRPNID